MRRAWTSDIVQAVSSWGLGLTVCLLVLPAVALAQEDGQEAPPEETHASQSLPDNLLPRISAAVQGVKTQDLAALSTALHIGKNLDRTVPDASANTLSLVGDLDEDGVPEVLLKWAIPDLTTGDEMAPAADSRPLWGVYLLSWDGARWKASRLVTGVEDFTTTTINLGPPVGRAVVVLISDGHSQAAFPVIFQAKDHAAVLMWDAEADDSQYEPFLQGRVSFQDHVDAPAEMIVTGRADPGLLQVAARGQRGFQARAVYHWDGKAFSPGKTEYSADQDYTLYRFISALHLHDYRSAYALVVPAKFLATDSPALDAFRQLIQDNWPELLQDQVFEAPESSAGAPDDHVFVLTKPDRRYVYHPVFSSDGKFLLTGLTRTQEALPAEP